MNMFEASQLLLVVVVWASRFNQVNCDVYKNLTDFDECRRMCQTLDETKLAASCKKECMLKTKENVNATASKPSPKLFLNFTTALPRISPTAEVWKNGCPVHYGPEPNEVIPGKVTGLTLTFAHEKEENSQGWVAKVSWTAPKDANASLNWRGYLIIWFSGSDSVDYGGGPMPANCKLVSKGQSYLVINETDGWKYPNNIYIAVVALPSNDERTELKVFRPRKPGWRTPIQFEPVSIKGRKRFRRLQSPEVIAILIVAGLITVFAIICIIKRMTGKSFHMGFTCIDKKKAGKKENEMKDQLIV